MSVKKGRGLLRGSTTKIPDKIATSLCCDSFSTRKIGADLLNLILIVQSGIKNLQ